MVKENLNQEFIGERFIINNLLGGLIRSEKEISN